MSEAVTVDHPTRSVDAPEQSVAAPPTGAGSAEATLAPRRLTTREAEILELMDGGLSARAIGERLGCGESTVRRGIARVCAKLGARTRAEAIAIHRAATSARERHGQADAATALVLARMLSRRRRHYHELGSALAATPRPPIPRRQPRPSALETAPHQLRVAAVAALAGAVAVIVIATLLTVVADVRVLTLLGGLFSSSR
jgi:DNA-binding CsgD family transcriptional regulator